MNYIKQCVLVVVLALVNHSIYAGVRFYVKNNTPNHIMLRFSGNDQWIRMNPNSEAPSFFNNGMSKLDMIEWFVLKKETQSWKLTKYEVKDANIGESGIEHLVILPDGKWSWEGNVKPAAEPLNRSR